MIQVHKANARHAVKTDWLESHLSFSFGPYYDSENIQFGPLRVFNDDTVQPDKGFGIHPHREAEIVSIVLKGQLKHEDSLGNSGTLHVGDVQVMSAGTGALHSEFNPSSTEETQFLQLWFLPNKSQLTPSYEDVSYDQEQLHNQLLPIISHTPSANVAKINQDVILYLSKLETGKELTFNQPKGRKIYVFAIEGGLRLNEETTLEKRDAARVTDTENLHIEASEDSFFLLIDLPGGQ